MVFQEQLSHRTRGHGDMKEIPAAIIHQQP